jgi:sugar transferase (PEP-CTERM/EpsH1 system associated)
MTSRFLDRRMTATPTLSDLPLARSATPTRASLTIAHVVLSLDCGGLERVVLDLATEGRKLGQQVAIVCIERPGALSAAAEAAGATVWCVDKPPGLKFRTVGRLKAVFRQLHPDVVHTHQIGALFYSGPAARRAKVPVIVHTEHGKHYSVRRRTRWLGRLAALYADRFCCVSQDIADALRAYWIVSSRKIQVVRNGIDTKRFREPHDADALRQVLGIPSHAPVIGTIGRLCEVKRQDVLLRGFASLKSQMPEAHLLLVGDGPLLENLRYLAKELGLESLVHFAGYQANPEAYLQCMNVFALTSESEGMPLSVLEAWAAGVPVVASRVGGLPELIDDGQTGLLFPPNEDRTLATIFYQLLKDDALAGALGASGRERVESVFGLGRMAADYQRHYLQLLGKAALDS